jgi:GntR family transcriptional regulator
VTKGRKDPKGAVPVNGEARLWEVIADSLREDIDAGRLKPGDTLPSEKQLEEQFSLSRTTVRRALAQLTIEGRLTEGRGRNGRQVAERTVLDFDAVRSESRAFAAERGRLGSDAYVTTAHEQGHTAHQDIDPAVVAATADIAQRLGIAEGERVWVRRRVRYLDGKPNDLNDTYYPADIADGTRISEPGDVAEGTIRYMQSLGYEQVRFADEVSARMPTPDEGRALRMPPGVPLIVQIRTGYTTERPVKVTVTRWRADRVQLRWEFEG